MTILFRTCVFSVDVVSIEPDLRKVPRHVSGRTLLGSVDVGASKLCWFLWQIECVFVQGSLLVLLCTDSWTFLPKGSEHLVLHS